MRGNIKKFFSLLIILILIFTLIACSNSSSSISLDKLDSSNALQNEKHENEHKENIYFDASINEFLDLVNEFGAPGILDPDNSNWPRKVEAMNGIVVIDEKPERIITISVGHDEMLFGFADIDTIIAASSFSKDPNGIIYELTKDLPAISSEIETIIAQEPDLVFADPFANPALIESLVDIGIPVVQTQLNNTYKGRINDILFASYVIGQTDHVFELISVIEKKISLINEFKELFIDNIPSVLSVTYYDAYWAAGEGSTEGSIIELVGAGNVASVFGVESNNMITKEALIEMNPEYIIIPQSIEWGGLDFYESLFSDESFQFIEAIANKNVYLIDTNYFTTLSHWNIVGAEKLIEILWPTKWSEFVDSYPQFYPCMNCDIY